MTTDATMPPMSKAYNPADHENRIWQKWTEADAFAADPGRVLDGDARPYCVLIPPPNVTAALHLGHALNGTIQDILVRAHRMMGYETLWMPGTDHAGIATQTMVDKRLQEQGKPGIADYKRKELDGGNGRDEFLAIVQEFKDDFEQRITNQFQKMGCSCDWKRQRFTMDDICARAVREAFFQLFKDGLIYRGKRLVNWDPVTQTALADDEVEMEEVNGHFYYLRYPLVKEIEGDPTIPVTWGELAARGYPDAENHPDDEQAWITVATTRPETYMGDTGVAVNPKDPRAGAVRGMHVMLPIVGRVIPIIEDDYVVLPVKYGGEEGDAKAEMSTGFLKVTPAHDPNDYMIGQRHDLEMINIMAPDASISDQHGWDREERGEDGHIFLGKSREEARKLVVKEFDARTVAEGSEGSLLEKMVPHRHSVGHSYRSHVPVEPYLSDQWYCKVTDDKLRGNAQRALLPEQRTEQSIKDWPESRPKMHTAGSNDGTMTFYPSRYAKTYEIWHDNLRDWCISRQLWWGHRIPVWNGSVIGPTEKVDRFESTMAAWWRQGKLTTQLTIDSSDPNPPLTNSGEPLIGQEIAVCVRDQDPEIIAFLEEYGFTQDPDVLDTWFSSALWPLSTMGWPDASAAKDSSNIADFESLLPAFNPTSVLCTAREIITLWVSRMTMFNRYFLGDEDHAGKAPFKDVFIHAMIQDGEGRKMSKTLGNGVDPLDIIDSHGSDAMRFTLCQMTTQTQDVRMPVELDESTGKNTSPKFDLGRNLCNKLWNASKFALGMFEKAELKAGIPISPEELSLVDRWMLSRVTEATNKVNTALRNYMFKDYADAIYDLFWRDFCDWYLESIKPTIADSPTQAAVLRNVIDAILRLIHPVMPFITETLFERFESLPIREIEGFNFETTQSSATLCQSGWPTPDDELRDEVAVEAYERVRSLVTAIREVRATNQVKPKRQITLHVNGPLEDDIARWSPLVETLAGVDTITADDPEGASSSFMFEGEEYQLSNLADALDAGAERDRLEKELASIEKNIKGIQGRLSNPGYVDKAPEHLVQQTRDQLAQLEKDHAATKAALDKLG
ncbi:MAG: valine--tRNA ligase [Phycisphaerales bacterium]|nr:valine--tRNA ligase [Phycisphaerales bacterium]